jgi:hypothetical protein
MQVPIKQWDFYRRALFRPSSSSSGSALGSIASGSALANIEFLGDSLVNATVRRVVNEEYPDVPVSDLTRLARKFISGIFMYRIGMLLQLDKFIVREYSVGPHASDSCCGYMPSTIIHRLFYCDTSCFVDYTGLSLQQAWGPFPSFGLYSVVSILHMGMWKASATIEGISRCVSWST